MDNIPVTESKSRKKMTKTDFDLYHNSDDCFSAKRYLWSNSKEPNRFVNKIATTIELGKPFDALEFFSSRGFEIISTETYKNGTEYILLNREREVVITLDNFEYFIIRCQFYFESELSYLQDLNKELTPYIRPSVNKKYVTFLGKTSSGFYLNDIELDKVVDIDFNINYNDDFAHDKIVRHVGSKDNGLILLGGTPGTGKSYYIKYLIHNLERSFLFIPNQYIDLLMAPEFMDFAIQNLKDYVLILEDAENVLVSRDFVKSSGVPTILNLTDGIVGDILNLTVICTYNTKDKIDTALFRKGRLLYEYHFDNLSIEKSNKLSEKLGYNVSYTKPTPLAEVYNIEENREVQVNKTIGFNI